MLTVVLGLLPVNVVELQANDERIIQGEGQTITYTLGLNHTVDEGTCEASPGDTNVSRGRR